MLAYGGGVAVLVLGDMLWLGVLMNRFYFSQLGHLTAENINWWGAGAFYLLYPLGVLVFAVLPQAQFGMMRVALFAALFGFIAYGVYDLTNQATLRDWPLIVTVVDMLWGAFLTTLMGLAMAWVLRINA